MQANDEGRVCGRLVEVDRSGVGHCWVYVTPADMPANVREEIEGEIIDGGLDSCDGYVASNGLHYRW